MFQSLFNSKLKWYSLTDLGKQKLCLCQYDAVYITTHISASSGIFEMLPIAQYKLNIVPVLCLVLTPTKGLLALIQACESLFIDLQ